MDELLFTMENGVGSSISDLIFLPSLPAESPPTELNIKNANTPP